MSGPPKIRSMNVADAEVRPVLGPAGNKARSIATRKPASKPLRKQEKPEITPPPSNKASVEEPKTPPAVVSSQPMPPSPRASLILRRQELLLHSNLSLNASCSSDASSDSVYSRASTGKIFRSSPGSKRKQTGPKPVKVAPATAVVLPTPLEGKRRCHWVTANTEPCYAAFHDEEWGLPVHDDKKLFELLVLSGALAELTWPSILSKRHTFREVFLDFDPASVAKLSEKKIISIANNAGLQLSEPKLRAVIENARLISKIITEFGSFDRYCWSFVNNKPIVNKFRYPRKVPVKTPKADVISKDLVKRGFRYVGPTVVYSFMQAAGITNDHLVSCFRFEECLSASDGRETAFACDGRESAAASDGKETGISRESSKIDEKPELACLNIMKGVEELAIAL
ncbi:hypothetical protein AMTRI_Chr12g239550 [Amborella trichopoda]|uniref:Uncharacterized protein n=1 Tax=Amborella trichopoda TaxID=13333 RepID=U5DB98_AMBTC|nr:uncharacterized protein LOC18447066 [Amborella trichopoda]ERN18697.1 hypothetical protein AMTR_s00065p00208780 [Amborella trichopoda]|eukprot:XP_006857230.1 uncharacterized protein LOC18447066 [Amborella trichopoda]